MAGGGCFRDYEGCVVDQASDFIDNLDCAVDLVACVKGRIFGSIRIGGTAETLESTSQVATSITDHINAILLVDREIRPLIMAARSAKAGSNRQE